MRVGLAAEVSSGSIRRAVSREAVITFALASKPESNLKVVAVAR